MRSVKKPDEPATRRSWLLIALVVVTSLLILALSHLSFMRSQVRMPCLLSQRSKANRGGPRRPPSTAVSSDDVVARLRTIFHVRDRAIQTRNSDVLNDIYTADCPCLKGDRSLIQGLQKEGLVWRGIKVSLVIEESSRVNDRLWVVSALVKTSPFNIETESGALVRSVPSGHEHSRFALAKPVGREEWLLGQASVISGRG